MKCANCGYDKPQCSVLLQRDFPGWCRDCAHGEVNFRYKEQEALGFPLLKATIAAQEKLKK